MDCEDLKLIHSPCERCGFSSQACFCSQFRKLRFHFDWQVVVHPREWKRMTSSSHFLAQHEVNVIEYQRTHPPAHLTSATVLFLTEDAEPFSLSDHKGPLVVLDGTWSEAKKMYAQWTKSLALQPKYVSFVSPSIYPFRKNQQEGGYSTAEVVLNIEKHRLNAEQASELDAYYASYLRSAWATLNGHAP